MYLCHISVDEWHKMQMYVLCSLWKFSIRGVQFLIPYVYGTGTWRVNELNEFAMNRWLASSQQIIADAYSQLGCEE